VPGSPLRRPQERLASASLPDEHAGSSSACLLTGSLVVFVLAILRYGTGEHLQSTHLDTRASGRWRTIFLTAGRDDGAPGKVEARQRTRWISERRSSHRSRRVYPRAKPPVPLDQEVAPAAHENISDEELAELIRRTAEAASALIGGDIRTYLTLVPHAEDYTLMDPFGGEPTRGFDASGESLQALERFFQGGEAELEVVESYTSGDLVVLVVIERQHGQVGGLPEQDLSLRVTWVFRREGSGWRQVHRHADPLVHGISLEQLAALARS
jgi:ketosteroid isomerase-like protein